MTLFTLARAGALLAVSCVAADTAFARSPAGSVDVYRLNLTVDSSLGRLDGRLVLQYRNVSTKPIASVQFRLDPNLSKGLSMEILAVEEPSGRTLRWSLKPLAFGTLNSDAGALEVTLPGPLPPGAETKLVMRFRGSGKNIGPDMLMLQDDPYPSLDAWYPKAMTPRDGSWSIDDDRLADYDVTLTLPAAFTVASTGRRAGDPTATGDHREWRLRATEVRGFTVFASRAWQRHARDGGRVALAVYLPSDAESYASRFLDTAADAIAFYEKEYGPYPATHLDIVGVGSMSDSAQGGSTDCNLIVVFLGTGLEQQYRFLIAHEVAHQYFSVRIGSPRDSIGWVPVGLGLMMDEHYAVARGFDADWGRRMRGNYIRAEQMHFDTTLSQSVQGPLKSPAPWSFGWNMALTHGKAYAVCAMLRDLMGPARFQDVVRTIIRQRSGGIVREADLITAAEAVMGQKLDWFVADWIDGRATFDYGIRSVVKSDDGWTVEVDRIGTGSFPAKVELTTEEGQVIVQRVDRTKPADVLRFKTSGKVRSVRLNPENVYPDLNPSDDVWPRAASGVSAAPSSPAPIPASPAS